MSANTSPSFLIRMQTRAKQRQQSLITLLIVTAIIFAIIGSITTRMVSKYKARAEAHYEQLYANYKNQSRLEMEQSIAQITEAHQKTVNALSHQVETLNREIEALNHQIETLHNENVALRKTIQIAAEVGVEVPFVGPLTIHWNQ